MRNRTMRIEVFKKYTKRIAGRASWGENEIRGLAKLLNSKRFGITERGCERFFMINEIERRLNEATRTWPITKEQSSKGIEYLRRRYFKKNGEPRKLCPFSETAQNIIRNFKRFEFVGLYEHATTAGSMGYLPIYRVISKHGSYFDYSPVHWGEPIIHSDFAVKEDDDDALPRLKLVNGSAP